MIAPLIDKNNRFWLQNIQSSHWRSLSCCWFQSNGPHLLKPSVPTSYFSLLLWVTNCLSYLIATQRFALVMRIWWYIKTISSSSGQQFTALVQRNDLSITLGKQHPNLLLWVLYVRCNFCFFTSRTKMIHNSMAWLAAMHSRHPSSGQQRSGSGKQIKGTPCPPIYFLEPFSEFGCNQPTLLSEQFFQLMQLEF